MRGSALLEELFQLAQKQGLTVRKEAMSRGSGTGGYCVLKGVPTIFVDDRSNVDAQIEVVATVLRRLDWSTVFVHPSVRPVLGLSGDGDTPKREPKASNDDVAAAKSDMPAATSDAPAEEAKPGEGAAKKPRKKKSEG